MWFHEEADFDIQFAIFTFDMRVRELVIDFLIPSCYTMFSQYQ